MFRLLCLFLLGILGYFGSLYRILDCLLGWKLNFGSFFGAFSFSFWLLGFNFYSNQLYYVLFGYLCLCSTLNYLSPLFFIEGFGRFTSDFSSVFLAHQFLFSMNYFWILPNYMLLCLFLGSPRDT